MKILIIISISLIAGCAQNQNIETVNRACMDGNIQAFKERKDGDELAFSCFDPHSSKASVL